MRVVAFRSFPEALEVRSTSSVCCFCFLTVCSTVDDAPPIRSVNFRISVFCLSMASEVFKAAWSIRCSCIWALARASAALVVTPASIPFDAASFVCLAASSATFCRWASRRCPWAA